MYRVTTPTHTFGMPIDTSECAEIQIIYKQCKAELIKHYQNGILPAGMTLDENVVTLVLTQEETKIFSPGVVKVQLRVLTTDNMVYDSQIFNIFAEKALNESVLS